MEVEEEEEREGDEREEEAEKDVVAVVDDSMLSRGDAKAAFEGERREWKSSFSKREGRNKRSRVSKIDDKTPQSD